MYGPPDYDDDTLPNGQARHHQHHQPRHPEQVELHVNPGFHGDPYRDQMGIEMEERGSVPVGSLDFEHSGSTRRWAAQNRSQVQDLIKDLPSHRLDQLVNTAATQGPIRSRKSRRSKYATTARVPKEMDVEEILDAMAMEAEGSDADLDDEVQMNAVIRDTVGTTLGYKKQLRREMTSKRKVRHVSWWKRQKYKLSMRFERLKYKMAEIAYFLKLWKGHMKKIEGHFGTGVLSYFRFLQWLFLLNIPIFILTLAFVVIPQVLFRYRIQVPPGYVNNTDISGTDILTGGGWFHQTEMYYGYYTDGSVTLVQGHDYNMQYAYLFTCGGYYLLCLIILAHSMSKSYRENYIEGSGEFGLYMATKVFGGWSCGITSVDAAKLKHRSLYNEFQEYLSGFAAQPVRTLSDRCKWFSLRLLSNIVVLGLIAGAAYLVYYLSTTQQFETDIPFLREMALPLTISGMLLILPFAFSVIASLEQYDAPKTELYIQMVRTMLLKGVILGVLIYYWFNQLPCPAQVAGNGTMSTLTEVERQAGNSRCERCWETLMGEQIYRLVLVDFVFVLVFTVLMEFVRRLLAQYCCKSLPYPEFNIGRNTLNLIYSQTLCWLGTFYSPLLSLITIIKLFIMFYVRRLSVMQNCRASLKPWRASRTHTIFLAFLFCFFLLATVAVACSIIFIQPSPYCGPYRGNDKAYDVLIDLIEKWESREPILSDIIDFVTSPGFIAGIIVILCVGTYYMHIIMTGHKEMVALMKNQLVLEGKDKTYLLDMLQMINRRQKDNRDDDVFSPAQSDRDVTPGRKHEFIKSKMADWEKQHSSDTFEKRGRGHRLF